MFNNNLISLGPFNVYWYGTMIAVGTVAAIIISYALGKKAIEQKTMINAMWVCLISGFVGAKLASVIVNVSDYQEQHGSIFDGFIVYGGIIAAALAVFIFSKVTKISFFGISDVFLPGIAIGQGIGRLGCFFAGCCYGKEYHGPGHVIFHYSEQAPNDIPLYPTQLVSSAFMIFLGIGLIILYKKVKVNEGTASLCYFFIYGVGRFIIEFFRYHEPEDLMIGLSGSQIISLFIFLVSGGVFAAKFFARKNNRQLS